MKFKEIAMYLFFVLSMFLGMEGLALSTGIKGPITMMIEGVIEK